MHTHMLHPGQRLPFEYTLCIEAMNQGRPLDTEQLYLEKHRHDTINMVVNRVNEFFDSIILMER